MKDLNTSIAISKDIPHVYFARALVKKNMGDLDGAIEDYSAAQMGDSIYAQALYNRSYSYQMMGDQARAMADAQTIVSLNEDDPASWNLKGNVHVLYGEYHQAVEAYEEAIRKDPQFARAYHNRGLAYHMSYRPIQGCADLERAVDLGFIESSNPHKYFCGF
jgi:tetratricopeptide (TPR) repeat protein